MVRANDIGRKMVISDIILTPCNEFYTRSSKKCNASCLDLRKSVSFFVVNRSCYAESPLNINDFKKSNGSLNSAGEIREAWQQNMEDQALLSKIQELASLPESKNIEKFFVCWWDFCLNL